ncbi:MAG: ribose-phosphate pyrophosphokinase [Bacteroidota bacterium]
MKEQSLEIFTGSASSILAEKIAKAYGIDLGKVVVDKFSDGEIQPYYERTVRGEDIFIIQSTYAPGDNILELLLMVDAAKRASAKRVIAVIPYFGYARQDRKDKARTSIGAKLVSNLLSAAGVDRVVTMDLHADQIQGFFDVPVDHLFSSTLFIPFIKKLNLPNLTMASPDVGGIKRVNAYAKILKSDLVMIYKQRAKANVVDKMTLIGEVRDRDIVLVDDLIDTAGTLCKASDVLLENGARSVRAVCTHAVLSGPAYERLENSSLTELIVTDTIPLKKECSKIRVLSVAELFADVIGRVHNYESISSHFDFNQTIL